MRVAVIGGGQNCEHDVSLATAAAVAEALPAPYAPVCLTIDRDGTWLGPDRAPLPGQLSGALALLATCSVVFPAVHGPRGEDGTLAALCELAGLPYVGSGLRAGALAMDKPTTKIIAERAGITVARSVTVTDPDGPVPLPLPVVVKPTAAGSSHGVSLVENHSHYQQAVTDALALDARVMVEEYIQGREIDIAVLRRADNTLILSPPLEITTAPRQLFDTQRKYDGTAQFHIPARLTTSHNQALARSATTLFRELGCAGTARFDFFLTDHGLVLNEVNTTPGLTPHSQVPKMFAAAGYDYPHLLTELLDTALTPKPAAPHRK
ncbi:D-alanine--D-alanine ligase family protein [Streptomyces albus]|uniref:D-alanine--D-alanine ligase family protein n=1 Tax=Streptomyces albus TaxID=1888 RepID=UPI00056A527B|nr:D-alanine--D-alanine ligase [Streptomyces albus]